MRPIESPSAFVDERGRARFLADQDSGRPTRGGPVLLNPALLSVVIGAMAVALVHASAPREPWLHRLICVVPLSAIAGTVLALAAAA